MKKFLVAVDGSEHSKKAVDMAIDMAEKGHAEIILIHVREERTVPEGLEPWMETEGIRSFGDYSEFVCKSDQFLGEAEAKIKAAHDIKVERICVNGDPADEILMAAELQCRRDNHGKPRFGKILTILHGKRIYQSVQSRKQHLCNR